MNKNGFYNEFEFIALLNKKCIKDLSIKYVELLEKIFNKPLSKNCYILCHKSHKTDKADLVIQIDNETKYISIKSGKNNSVHLESLFEFKIFLKEIGLSDKIIEKYQNYHFAIDKFGNRQSAKEYQELHQDEIICFNSSITMNMLEKIIDRFLFSGINKRNNQVNAIIYGTPDCFMCATRKEIVDYLKNNKDEFNSIHFSSLVLQPWTRNLNYNPKYEYRRKFVQVKWYRLEEAMKKIVEK